MTRVIAGSAKGRRLAGPRGAGIRPTAGRVKQTLFDILAAHIPGCRFLDLCAGTGAVGLEALSRGAARVVLVEKDAHAVTLIRRNAALLGSSEGEVDVRGVDVLRGIQVLAREGRRFDLVFLDPPYESDLYESTLEALDRVRMTDETGEVVVEHFHKRALPETIGALARHRSVRVGDHCLSFYRRAR